MSKPIKGIWNLSLATNPMSFLLVCGATLGIAAVALHLWSRLLWLICGGCFGAFFGFIVGSHYAVRPVMNRYLEDPDSDEDLPPEDFDPDEKHS